MGRLVVFLVATVCACGQALAQDAEGRLKRIGETGTVKLADLRDDPPPDG